MIFINSPAFRFGINFTVISGDSAIRWPAPFAARKNSSSKNKTRHTSMNTKQPECWSSDSQSQGLRIELSLEHLLVLPYDQFLLAEIKIQGADHHLRLVFSMHEIIITGRNLKRVLIAMQKKELAFIAKVPDGSQSFTADGGPVISVITVKEMPPRQSQSQTAVESEN
jgi:hypothetical protein